MNEEISRKVKVALEHEKDFWNNIVPQDKFKSMQKDWENTANAFESLSQKYIVLDASSRVVQIGSAVQDAINFWKTGRRFAVDPLALYYKENWVF
jgi:rRNA processing protein Krr1/Pno1